MVRAVDEMGRERDGDSAPEDRAARTCCWLWLWFTGEGKRADPGRAAVCPVGEVEAVYCAEVGRVGD